MLIRDIALPIRDGKNWIENEREREREREKEKERVGAKKIEYEGKIPLCLPFPSHTYFLSIFL